jgi:hypothetical protein
VVLIAYCVSFITGLFGFLYFGRPDAVLHRQGLLGGYEATT